MSGGGLHASSLGEAQVGPADAGFGDFPSLSPPGVLPSPLPLFPPSGPLLASGAPAFGPLPSFGAPVFGPPAGPAPGPLPASPPAAGAAAGAAQPGGRRPAQPAAQRQQ